MAGELKRGPGKPTVMTPDVLAKLDQAFEWGCTDKEACLHADISTTALYEYCKLHPAYAERKELLKETTTINARRTVYEQVKAKAAGVSQWHLERKRRDEYGNTPGVALNITVPTIHYGRIEELNQPDAGRGNTQNIPPVPVASVAGTDAGGSGDSGSTER